MRPKDELKKWITDTKKEVLDSENNYMFFLIPPDTVESILVLFDEFMNCLDLTENQKGEKWIVNYDNGVKFGTIDLKCPKCGHCVICPKVDVPSFCGKCGLKLER